VKKLVRKGQNDYEVTIYIDGVFEHHRLVKPGVPVMENDTLHVMENQSRIALVRAGDAFPDDGVPEIKVKYDLGDHLGSSNVITGGKLSTDSNVINREEYFAYGETSFGICARKRYRFTGKERDEESGLYYHGVRYYAPWLRRWVSCDPLGAADQLNLYSYVHANPLRFFDTDGRYAKTVPRPFVVPAPASPYTPPPQIGAQPSSTSQQFFPPVMPLTLPDVLDAIDAREEMERQQREYEQHHQNWFGRYLDTLHNNELISDADYYLARGNLNRGVISCPVISYTDVRGKRQEDLTAILNNTPSPNMGMRSSAPKSATELSKIAQRAFANTFSQTPALDALWRRAAMGKANSPEGFDKARERFWEVVNSSSDPDAVVVRAILKEAGYELQGGKLAPLLKLQTGDPKSSREQSDLRLSIDHADPKSVNPSRTLDPAFLRFMSQRDNSFRGNRFDVNDQPR
jgi:RHS repeat-associated protein